jgi:hypothetical protein
MRSHHLRLTVSLKLDIAAILLALAALIRVLS